MKKLFMISLGGKVAGGNIEVHDVQFAVGESIEVVVPLVKACWYGMDFKLHMDSWKEIKGTEGHSIEVTETPQDSEERLYFICLGGYQEHCTQEIHDIRLVLASSDKEAKVKAGLMDGFVCAQPHVDHVTDVQKCLLSEDEKTYYLKMTATDSSYDLVPDWFGYRRLDLE